ncbi:alpha/beta fold hydrolase [Oceanicaulis sp.]|uniref:alpha/beta fold hydrolase n=1 Tax=Oceanicaulis sp. TaxID=1924941 RepID=UPI003D2E5EE2
MQAQASLQAWRAAGAFFKYRGHDIFYRTGGDWSEDSKPVLVLIHGFPTASWDWVQLWDDLCRDYRVAVLDMIGFGYSDKPVRYAYSIMDQADLHDAFFAHLEIKACHLFVHDYGDTVAQELLARHLEQGDASAVTLQSICFLNGGLFPEQHRATLTQKLLHSPLGPFLARLMTRDKFAKGLSEVFGPDTQPDPEDMDAFWALAQEKGGMPRIGHKLLGYITERRQHRERWVGALVNSTLPMKVIDGGLDPVSGAHMVERYRALVPNADTLVLPHVGHYPHWEDPKAVLDGFMNFQSAMPKAR